MIELFRNINQSKKRPFVMPGLQVHCWFDYQDKFKPWPDGEGEDVPKQAQPHPSLHSEEVKFILVKLVQSSHPILADPHSLRPPVNSHDQRQVVLNFNLVWLSGSGRRTGRVSSRTSSGRPRPMSRCARTTWSSSSCSVKRSSTSALARWPRRKRNTSRTQCVRSFLRYVLNLRKGL